VSLPPESNGENRRLRAGVGGLALAWLLISDPPLRECLAALEEEDGTPKQLADRLDLNDDVVSNCCQILARFGFAERV
jgi:hypothetical protein